jgi:hypothetical protein
MDQRWRDLHLLDGPLTFTLPDVSPYGRARMSLEERPHGEAENVPFRIEGRIKQDINKNFMLRCYIDKAPNEACLDGVVDLPLFFVKFPI